MNINVLVEKFKNGDLKKDIYTTINEFDENVIVICSDDFLEVNTYQNNDWILHQVYYKNGDYEEIYEK